MPQATATSHPSPAPDPVDEIYQLLQGWMDACHGVDAEKYMSYYSESLTYLNVAIKDFGTITYDDFNTNTHDDFRQEGCDIEFNLFFISPDGKSVAIEGTYNTRNRSGRQVSILIAIILEIQNGKIVRQTDYLDGGFLK